MSRFYGSLCRIPLSLLKNVHDVYPSLQWLRLIALKLSYCLSNKFLIDLSWNCYQTSFGCSVLNLLFVLLICVKRSAHRGTVLLEKWTRDSTCAEQKLL